MAKVLNSKPNAHTQQKHETHDLITKQPNTAHFFVVIIYMNATLRDRRLQHDVEMLNPTPPLCRSVPPLQQFLQTTTLYLS
jgi:hypothetical protein